MDTRIRFEYATWTGKFLNPERKSGGLKNIRIRVDVACERRRIFSVTGSDENNVCEPELENDFCDVAILSQSQFSSEKPRTTARCIRTSQENKVQQQWRIMWMLLSVKY